MVQVNVVYEINDGRETAGHAVNEDKFLIDLFTTNTGGVEHFIKDGVCKVVSVIIMPHD